MSNSSGRKRKIWGRSSAFSFRKLPWLYRRLWRNSHMSDKDSSVPQRCSNFVEDKKFVPSPSMVRHGYSRNSKNSHSRSSRKSVGSENLEQCNDDFHDSLRSSDDDDHTSPMDYIIFPVSSCDANKKEVPRIVSVSGSPSKLLTEQIEGRRPLHSRINIFKNYVIDSKCTNNHNVSTSNGEASSHHGSFNGRNQRTIRISETEDDSVQFVKEIKTSPSGSPGPKPLRKKQASPNQKQTKWRKKPSQDESQCNNSCNTSSHSTPEIEHNKVLQLVENQCNDGTKHNIEILSIFDAEDIIVPSPSNISSNSLYTSAMQTSDREVNDKSDDDDVIVVPTENNENPDIDYPTLKRIINISDAKDLTVPSPSNNMDISSNSFNTSAMQTSDMEVDENSDDDDIIVVQTENNENQDIDYPTLKRIINSMVSHFIEENPGNEVTPHYIIQRLKALYHKDFSNRLQEIKYCIGRSNEQYISRKKMLREIRPGVRKSDIITLYSDNWLNDIIINQYMSILIQNNKNYGAISSFWLEELLRRVEPSLPHNWDKMKCILAPTCVEFHWSLLCYYPEKYNVVIYSSLSVCKTVLACASKLLNFFNNKQGKEGRCLIRKDLPRQENEHDCGVYVCMFARCVVFGNTFDIEPAQVCAFRKWLKNEIVQGKLFESKEEVTTEEYSDSESEDNDEE